MKKSSLISIMVIGIMLVNTVVYAGTINIVDSNSENYILNEDIKFTKEIVNYDTEKQEVEIELCIENIKKNIKDKEDIEIAVVLDNSSSMCEMGNGITRKAATYESTNKFINLLYDNIKKLKVGIVQFADNTVTLSPLTDSVDTALTSLEKYKNMGASGNTYTHTALESVKSLFSSECKNKVIVLVTDGYPNYPEATKQKLEQLEEEGIYVLSLIISKENDIPIIQGVFGTEEEPTAGNVFYIEDSNEIDETFTKYIYKQILNYMQHPITNVKIEDVFPEEILKYFDIKYINKPTEGKVSTIGDNNSFTWSIDEITGEEVLIFRYKVKIKENVDINKIIGLEFKTNEKVIINYEDEKGNEHEEIFDKNPAIEITEDENNPNDISNTIVAYTLINEDDDDNDNNNDLDNQEFVVVDITPKEEDNTKVETKKVSNTTTTTTTTTKEKLPQTGKNDYILIAIGASVVLAVVFGVKTGVISRKIKKLGK